MRVLRPLTLLSCLTALSLGASAAYTVQPGDTLSGIAKRLGVQVGDLAQANGIIDPNKVFAGRQLEVPGAATPAVPATVTAARHVVGAGENLTIIARRYGTTVSALAAANGLNAAAILREGARLTVPASGAGGSVGVPAGLPLRLRQIPARLALIPVFERWAAANGIPADLLMAMTWLESGWQNGIESYVGAIGIGQLMPDTVRFVRGQLIGIPSLDPRVPEDNIRMSARFLRYLLERTDGDVRVALAGYYQGLRSVRENGAFRQTVQYVDGVQSLRPRFRR